MIVHRNFTPPKPTTFFIDIFRLIKMRCIKCHSPRIIKFIDGFGNWRIFCRTCQENFLENDYYHLKEIKRLPEFSDHHTVKLGISR